MSAARYTLYSIPLLAVAALAWSFQHRASADEKSRLALAKRVAQLEAAPQKTERVVEREVRIETAPSSVTGSAVEQRPSAPAESDAEEQDRPAAVARSNAQLAAAYAHEFAAEPVDRGWAQEARGTFLPPVQANLPKSSRIESFECRSKFCELVVVHENMDSSNEFLFSLFGLQQHGPLLSTSGGFRAAAPTPTPDGKLAYHVYIARPGTALALAEPTEAAESNE